MSELANTQTTALAAASETSSLMEVITRAASDPTIDVDKLERLMSMHERMQDRNAKLAFLDAKMVMKPKLPHIDRRGHIIIKDSNGAVKQDTPFARLEDIQLAVMPILNEHGFDLDWRNGLSPDGKVRVTTILSHVAGHQEETHFDLPHDSSGSKNAVQAVGSSTKYGMRYGAVAILGLRVVGEDDDGATSDLPMPLTGDHLRELQTIASERGADLRAFCRYLKVPTLAELPDVRFEQAKADLLRKKAA